MYKELVNKTEKMAVIGLGYVGLPIALEFAKKISVIGYDMKDDRIQLMKKGIDPSHELPSEAFQRCDIAFTSNPEDLRKAKFYFVAVPTPIDEHKLPDLKPLLSATRTVGNVLKEGDYVVYESTVYPGCTEEDCVPVLENLSGLKYIKHFKVGFSPERINPGDKEHTLTKIIKVTSGCDLEAAEEIALTYELIIDAGVYRAGSIKIAEAAKPAPPYHAVIVAVSHREYINLDEAYFKSLGEENFIFVDIKGIYKKMSKKLQYLSL